jgi:hypothetical protein
MYAHPIVARPPGSVTQESCSAAVLGHLAGGTATSASTRSTYPVQSGAEQYDPTSQS